MSLKHPIIKSFPFAIEGIKAALKNEPNFRIHTIIAILALALGIYLKLTPIEFSILILTISFVIILELINTTLEALVDLVSPDIVPQAKIAKDVAAGAVLVSAIISVIIGVLLFIPKIINL